MLRTVFIALFLLVPLIAAAQPVDSTLYRERSFTLATKTGALYGTLCTPAKVSRPPVALIIAGSGPTDRNGNSPMGVNCDAYKILAHRLAASGIATLRYDKRGIAESRGAMASESAVRFEDYIDDARLWLDTLKANRKFSSVIAMGHSEGSLIGLVAAKDHAGKFISLSGIGTRAADALKRQLSNLPEKKRDTAYAVLDSLAAGHLVKSPPKALASLFRPSIQPYLISWFEHDPQAEIAKLKIPVLILQGTHDLQVTVQDAKLLAAADPKARLVLIDSMNHIFRIVSSERTDNVQSYTDPGRPISDEMVREIVSFIERKS